MLSKTLTASFALAAVLAQLVLAGICPSKERKLDKYCDEYISCLKNEDEHSKSINTEVATTIKAIKEVDGCGVDVTIAIDLEADCRLSITDEIFGKQIAHYVETCSNEYWTNYLGSLGSKNMDRSKLKSFPEDLPNRFREKLQVSGQSELEPIFPEEFINKYRKRALNGETLQFYLVMDELTSVFRNSIKEYDGAQRQPEAEVHEMDKEFREYYKGRVHTPCAKFVEYYKDPMFWIGRALLVVSDDKVFLDSLQQQARELFLQFKICKFILESPEAFDYEMFYRFLEPESYGMTENYELVEHCSSPGTSTSA